MAACLRFHLRQQAYLFHLKIGFFLLCLFFFSLLCLLGSWQLQRYHFKQSLLSTYDQRLNAVPQPFSAVMRYQDLQFQPVIVEGDYVPSVTILMQNQMRHNHMGFEVFSALRIKGDKKLLLIDRGWVQKPHDKILPDIVAVNGEQHLKGYIKVNNEYQFTLGKNILQAETRPLVMQKIDFNELTEITHEAFYPFVLRLDPSQENGFEREWVISVSTPERHLGYAVQWFLMAIALFIAYLCFCIERVKGEEKK